MTRNFVNITNGFKIQYDRDVFDNRDLIDALNEYQEKVRALTDFQEGVEKMGPETYKGKEALINLVLGMKLMRPHWVNDCYIRMNAQGLIYDEARIMVPFDETADYIEYQEHREPKQKHTYYRAYYRLKDSPLKSIYSTGWHYTEKDMMAFVDLSREIVETETREF